MTITIRSAEHAGLYSRVHDDGSLAVFADRIGIELDPDHAREVAETLLGQTVVASTTVSAALNELHAVTGGHNDDAVATRIRQAVKLAAVDMPSDLLDIAIKIRSRNAITTDDLEALRRAGIYIGISTIAGPDRTGVATITPAEDDPDEPETLPDGEVELGRLTIRRTLDEDALGVRVGISDGLAWWDAIAMLAAAGRSIDAIYADGDDDE